MTKSLVAVLVLFFLSTNVVQAQDDVSNKLISALEQIQALKDEIAKLSNANLILANENENLEQEIEQLKSNGASKKSVKATLSDIFVVGAVFTSKAEHLSGPTRGTTGSSTFTITSRDGNSFTATNAWVVNDERRSSGTTEIKGTINGDHMAKWKGVDAPLGMETRARLRPDGLYIDTQATNAKGLAIKGVLKVEQ